MLFTVYFFIITMDIDALKQQWFSSTLAKFNKKHGCCIENVMKSNHKGRQEINICSQSLVSEAKEMSHHIQSRILLYTENRAITACIIEKSVFAAFMILTVSCI